jgi:hypothetical protein
MIAGIAALVLGAGVALADPDTADHAAMHRHWRQIACTEHFARLSARLAYLEVKLDLTAEQRPLWDKWRAAAADGAGKVRQACLDSVPATDAKPTIVDRLAHLQARLSTAAAALQTAQPSLAALYQSLTPEQREQFEHVLRMGRHHGHHGGWGHHGWDHHGGDRDRHRDDRGGDDRGGDDRGGDDHVDGAAGGDHGGN